MEHRGLIKAHYSRRGAVTLGQSMSKGNVLVAGNREVINEMIWWYVTSARRTMMDISNFDSGTNFDFPFVILLSPSLPFPSLPWKIETLL
jgi:hypothetical protein